jgi:hypothetical protein
VFLRLAPPGPLVPPDWYGRPVLGLVPVWTGDPAAGQRAIAPLRRLARPVADMVRPLPYLFLQSMVDAANQHGMHYYWRSQRLPELADGAVEAVVGLAETITSPLSYVVGLAMGGAAGRVDPDATAVGERGNGFELSILAGWPPPAAAAARHVAWVREGWTALRPYSGGVYPHFLSDEGAAGVQAAYGGHLGRLTALKDRWDPTNFFRMNANIPPSAGPAARQGRASAALA